jgi:single stranded DNA-binding protein
MSYCFVTAKGNLGKDVEVFNYGDNKTGARASLAVWQGKDKPAGWYNITGFEKTAELMKHLKKGTRVVVHGSLEQRQYEDKSGNKRTDVGILVRYIDEVVYEKSEKSNNKDSLPESELPF